MRMHSLVQNVKHWGLACLCSAVLTPGAFAGFMPAKFDLPVLRLDLASRRPVASKERYEPAKVSITPPAGSTQTAYVGEADVKAHGNYTLSLPKTPYRIKLKTKASLLGMPADKDWILLANHIDKSLIRTEVAMELSRRLGLRYTPRSRFVELIVNGNYVGTYQLIEKIEISSDRLNIAEAKNANAAAVDTGYLIEAEIKRRDVYHLTTGKRNIPFKVHSPEPMTPSQLKYLANYLDLVEGSLRGDYAAHIDVNSFIDWYLVNEFSKNNDAVFFTSVYLFKDRGAKLAMGPAWDFDLAFGNTSWNDCTNPHKWWIRTGPWFDELFTQPKFRAALKARWNAIKQTHILTLIDYAGAAATKLELAQRNNFNAWPVMTVPFPYAQTFVPKSYKEEITHLQGWMRARYNWMDAQINQ